MRVKNQQSNPNSQQTERTAWRQVLRWVEAQLSMIEIGMVQTHEVFQPYALIPGTEKTMFEAWESQMKALPAPAGEAIQKAEDGAPSRD